MQLILNSQVLLKPSPFLPTFPCLCQHLNSSWRTLVWILSQGCFMAVELRLSSLEWMAIQVSLLVGRVQVSHSPYFIQVGMTLKQLDSPSQDGWYSEMGYLLRSDLERKTWVSPHQRVSYSPVSVLNCEWKPSVWAHTGTLEKWTPLCEKPAVSWRKDAFHHLLHPGTCKATTRHVLWTLGIGPWSVISQMGHSERKVW